MRRVLLIAVLVSVATATAVASAAAPLDGYVALLDRAGHRVTVSSETLAAKAPARGATLVVLNGNELTAADRDALRRFVAAGGRVVFFGSGSALGPGFSDSDVSVAGSPQAGRWASGGRLRRISEGTITFAELPVMPGITTLVKGPPDRPFAFEERHGAGVVVRISDPWVFYNWNLPKESNAAFALVTAGDPSRPVDIRVGSSGERIVSATGGGGSAAGPLPGVTWWVMLALLALATWLWATGARLGPPEPRSRALAPPRRGHAYAVARALAAAPDRAGLAPELALEARRRLLARAGLPPHTEREAVRQMALARNIDPDLAAALAEPAGASLIDAGRALAAVYAGRSATMGGE